MGDPDEETLKTNTACIVGQTVYFYLSRNINTALFGLTPVTSVDDIRKLSDHIYRFSLAGLGSSAE